MKKDFLNFCFGFFIILLFYLASHFLTRIFNLHFPEAILGLILFILALQFKIIKEDWVKKTCDLLIKNMSLFLVPYLVGLVVYKNLLIKNWLLILFVAFATTALVIIFVGFFVEYGLKLTKIKRGENE